MKKFDYTLDGLNDIACKGGVLGKREDFGSLRELSACLDKYGYGAIAIGNSGKNDKIILTAKTTEAWNCIREGHINTLKSHGCSERMASEYCKVIFTPPKVKYALEKDVVSAVLVLSKNPCIRYCPMEKDDMIVWRRDKEYAKLIPQTRLSNARFGSVLEILYRLPTAVDGAEEWTAERIFANPNTLF